MWWTCQDAFNQCVPTQRRGQVRYHSPDFALLLRFLLGYVLDVRDDIDRTRQSGSLCVAAKQHSRVDHHTYGLGKREGLVGVGMRMLGVAGSSEAVQPETGGPRDFELDAEEPGDASGRVQLWLDHAVGCGGGGRDNLGHQQHILGLVDRGRPAAPCDEQVRDQQL